MKTFQGSLGFSPEVESVNRRLLRNLGLLGLLLLALVTGTVLYFDHRLVRVLSENLIDRSRASTLQELNSFFRPVERNLRVAVRQVQRQNLKSERLLDALFSTLSPFVLEFDRIDGVSLANPEGDAYVLLESAEREGELLERFTRGSADEPVPAKWRRWHAGQFVESWERMSDFHPVERPWYQGVRDAPLEEVRWTEPYSFFTTKEPGITASVRWSKPDLGEELTAALDVSLTDIARFTKGLLPTPNGMVFVFTEDGRVVGLPASDRFDSQPAFLAALLRPLAELGLGEIDDAVSAWEQNGRAESVFSFESAGQAWWAGFSAHSFDSGSRIYVGVLVPDTDLLADIGNRRNMALSAILGGGTLIAVLLLLGSLRRLRQELKQTVSQIERRLGQYKLKSKIGSGGNGDVYLASHALLRRPTAIKIMRPEFARSEVAKSRFEHEVQITANLTHPNTVAIYDFGKTPEATLYCVMELLTGYTLETLVRMKGALPPARVLHILDQVCGSLAEAHGKGLIHRDIKPANIMLCVRGGLTDVVKVLDFGLVKETEEADPDGNADLLVGTPHYMAPEVIQSPGRAGVASDLYALGAVAYFLITGRNLFEGQDTVEVCAKHLYDDPEPPSRVAGRPVPPDLEALVLGCLAKAPEARPKSAGDLADRLRDCGDFGSWTARDAETWWGEHQMDLPLGAQPQEHAPLSDTQLVVDMDERLETLRRSFGPTAG
jgi:serine/threonine protein kinase